MEYILQLLRQVAFFFDQVTYGLIPSAYELIFYLANINLVDNSLVVSLIGRIYLLLGIFMLFKVSFSIMQYIVDPNAFSDKSKGFGKLVTNSLVSVVLLATVPFIFSMAYELQSKIILSNVIPRVILGDTSYDDYSEGTVDEAAVEDQRKEIHSIAVDLQFTLFSAFYSLSNDKTQGFTECVPTDEFPNSNIIGSADMVNNKDCWGAVEKPMTEELHKQGGTLRGIFKYCEDSSCSHVGDDRNFSTLGSLLWWKKGGGLDLNFTVIYFPLISALVGGYILLLLVTFSIEIAARVFKLLFLQAVAPIAIVSYIDPKESASNGKLHSWISESVKTYTSLFLRLAVIYLAIYLIKLITSVVFTAIDPTTSKSIYYGELSAPEELNMFIFLLLILGIFTFAKQVPKMIESIFNIKSSGDLNLNPFKAIGGNAGATALIGGAVGLAAGGAAAAMQRHQLGGGIGRSALSGVGGALTGAFGGAKNGFMSGGKGYVGAGLKQGGRTAWNMYDRHGTTFGSRLRAGFQNTTGAPMDSFIDKQKAEAYKGTMDGIKTIKDNAKSWALRADANGHANHQEYANAYAVVERMKAQGIVSGDAWAQAQRNLSNYEAEIYKQYVDGGHLGTEDRAIIDQINFTAKENRGFDGYHDSDGKALSASDWNSLNNIASEVKKANTELARSNSAQDHSHAEESAKRRAQRGWRSKQ